MSREITNKSVDKLVEAIHDNRFSPVLFASHLVADTQFVNSVFFDICLAYIETMANRERNGVTSLGNNAIQKACLELLVGGNPEYQSDTINLNIYDS
jgi:hypothetical protein